MRKRIPAAFAALGLAGALTGTQIAAAEPARPEAGELDAEALEDRLGAFADLAARAAWKARATDADARPFVMSPRGTEWRSCAGFESTSPGRRCGFSRTCRLRSRPSRGAGWQRPI
jgi:hypothetical protein